MYNSNELGHLSARDLLAESRSYETYVTANGASLNLGTTDSDAIKGVNNALEGSLDQKDSLENQLDGVLRWISKDDSRGEWSEIIEATING